jgi:hypothetical protein
VIAEDTPALRILIDHELFHRYHYQVAKFSDDNAKREVISKTLWAEGLAASDFCQHGAEYSGLDAGCVIPSQGPD